MHIEPICQPLFDNNIVKKVIAFFDRLPVLLFFLEILLIGWLFASCRRLVFRSLFFVLSIAQFHGQLDPLLFEIHAQDLHIHNIADRYSLQRMPDEAVADLRNMDKSVLVHADIHESTKINDIADSAFQDHARF